MKPFGTGSSLFYLKNNVGRTKNVSITDQNEHKIKGDYMIEFKPSKEDAKTLVLRGTSTYEIEISSRYLEKCEDLCGNTYVTLVPAENIAADFKQILIIL